MNRFRPGFTSFTRSQQVGLLMLCIIVVALQMVIFLYRPSVSEPTVEELRWLALQKEVDKQKNIQLQEKQQKFYRFNPNFIDDFKGYQLGMSVAEIDRLLEFRKTGKFVNSAAEFQKVTGVSDSLLAALAPRFKFPDWVEKAQAKKLSKSSDKTSIPKIDINQATAEELIAIRGIGPALSERILKMRTALGAFVSMEQMSDVWGLSPEVVDEIKKRFFVEGNAEVKKIRINDASLKELSAFPYFRYPVSKEIVAYRSMHGGIKSKEDLEKIKNLPSERIDIICLYLEL